MSYIEQIDKTRIPQHVAIIMDGNGRWAKQRGKERTYGHHAGAETVQKITEDAARLGIKYLTLYTFSTENWNRPQKEVSALMNLLLDSIEEETLMKNNLRFQVIGDFMKLPADVQASLKACIEHTVHNTGMCLVLALSYSSRWEITEAARQIAAQVKAGEISPEQIRLSNYMLWQCAYSELYFCDTFWPDFDNEELYKAICEYQQRERRFGKTSEQIS